MNLEIVKEDPINDYKNQSVQNIAQEKPNDLVWTIEKLIETQSEFEVAKIETNVYKFKEVKREPLYRIV
jgi:hypothetical protein